MAKDELTPMMRQFHDMKASNPDAILLFRCGDFYETYCEDAVICDGRVLMRDKHVPGEEEIMERASRAAYDLMRRGGKQA